MQGRSTGFFTFPNATLVQPGGNIAHGLYEVREDGKSYAYKSDNLDAGDLALAAKSNPDALARELTTAVVGFFEQFMKPAGEIWNCGEAKETLSQFLFGNRFANGADRRLLDRLIAAQDDAPQDRWKRRCAAYWKRPALLPML